MKQWESLRKYCEDNHIPFDDQIENQFTTFCEMLIEKNKVMNLTAVTDPAEIEQLHFIDSLAAADLIQRGSTAPANKEISAIDLGTGAGFPGLPLSFVLPEVHFLLADALGKRIRFIQEVVDLLHLSNVTAVQARAEDLGQDPQYREQYDFCVSRAVADTSVLLEYCLPLVTIGGYLILYKSGDYQEELKKASYALSVLGGEVHDVQEFRLADSSIRRSLLIIQKTNPTPGKYPRRAGKPAKSPLIKKIEA